MGERENPKSPPEHPQPQGLALALQVGPAERRPLRSSEEEVMPSRRGTQDIVNYRIKKSVYQRKEASSQAVPSQCLQNVPQ